MPSLLFFSIYHYRELLAQPIVLCCFYIYFYLFSVFFFTKSLFFFFASEYIPGRIQPFLCLVKSLDSSFSLPLHSGSLFASPFQVNWTSFYFTASSSIFSSSSQVFTSSIFAFSTFEMIDPFRRPVVYFSGLPHLTAWFILSPVITLHLNFRCHVD